jgi:hypothetical protein
MKKTILLFMFFFIFNAQCFATTLNAPTVTDANITGLSSSYSTARSTGVNLFDGDVDIYVGQLWDYANYNVYRGFLKFDTTSIPIGATITQVNIKLVCNTDWTFTNDFDVQIVKQNWSAQEPLGSNKDAAFDGCLNGTADSNIWRNTLGMSENTEYTSGNLDTAWVNKAGYTYYCLRSSRDKNNTTPTFYEFINIAEILHSNPTYRPVLIIEYNMPYTVTLGTTPTATTGTTPTVTLGG